MCSWTTAIAIFHVSVFVKTPSRSICLACHLHFFLFLCVTLSLSFSGLNFTLCKTYTASCSVLGYWLFLIVYLMDKSWNNYPYFILSDPIMKIIFDHASNACIFTFVPSSISLTLSTFFNSLVVSKKLSIFLLQYNFSLWCSLV